MLVLVSALQCSVVIEDSPRTPRKEMERDEYAVEILRYLIAHPLAKDAISGIEKWWLAGSTRAEGRRRIEEALNLLVSKSWLIGRSSPQTETIYSLNEDSLPEIRDFLNESH